MVSSAPIRRLMIEKDLSTKEISMLTGIPLIDIQGLLKSEPIIKLKTIDTLCRVLRIQPCDILCYENDSTHLEEAMNAVKRLSKEDRKKLLEYLEANIDKL